MTTTPASVAFLPGPVYLMAGMRLWCAEVGWVTLRSLEQPVYGGPPTAVEVHGRRDEAGIVRVPSCTMRVLIDGSN